MTLTFLIYNVCVSDNRPYVSSSVWTLGIDPSQRATTNDQRTLARRPKRALIFESERKNFSTMSEQQATANTPAEPRLCKMGCGFFVSRIV